MPVVRYYYVMVLSFTFAAWIDVIDFIFDRRLAKMYIHYVKYYCKILNKNILVYAIAFDYTSSLKSNVKMWNI